jgi:hypothetical protein
MAFLHLQWVDTGSKQLLRSRGNGVSGFRDLLALSTGSVT